MMTMNYGTSLETDLTSMLRNIYQCKQPFTLLTFDKRCKTKLGCYVVGKKRIRIYTKHLTLTQIKEVAIHEYAHHIHFTEKRKTENHRVERIHGPEFWRIYSALMCAASTKGIFVDGLIADIIRKE